MYVFLSVCVYSCICVSMDAWMNEWREGGIETWRDGHIHVCINVCIYAYVY